MTTATQTPQPSIDQPRIDAWLFDLGGVLVKIDFQLAFAHWAHDAGVAVEQIKTRYHLDHAYEAHERGEISAAQYFDHLRHALGIALTDEQFNRGWCAIFRGVIPGAAELVAQLAQLRPVYVFSNTNAAHYTCWFALYPELLAPVTKIFCSQDLGLRKPSLEAYEKVCALIGLPPERIAFFDDLAENIEGARKAGLNAFHTPTFAATQRAVQALLKSAL